MHLKKYRACVVPGGAERYLDHKEMRAYINLHGLGYAHSVESWFGGKLAGGLYGVSLGKAFFGESMFHVEGDASKVALATLVEKLRSWDFHFIDSQMTTEHMLRLGARELPRRTFLKRLQSALRHPTRRGKWRIEN
jgi:leucyl/phenylalanyl-tRNA--protein transferase